MAVSMKTIFRRVAFCHLITTEFIAFLVSGEGQDVITNNSFSIHVEKKNILPEFQYE